MCIEFTYKHYIGDEDKYSVQKDDVIFEQFVEI